MTLNNILQYYVCTFVPVSTKFDRPAKFLATIRHIREHNIKLVGMKMMLPLKSSMNHWNYVSLVLHICASISITK